MENKPDNVVNIEELSVYLKISKSMLYKLVRREWGIPSQKVGRHLRFHRELIDGWSDVRNQNEE